jgi:hypothetical protein
MITAQIEMLGLKMQLENLVRVSSKDAAAVVQDEHRLLTKTIVNFTPPTPALGMSARKAGENAIKRELASFFSEADASLIDTIGSEHGLTGINTYITQKDGQKLQLLWNRIDPLGEGMEAQHKAIRNNRGKIPPSRKSGQGSGKWSARVIVPRGTLAAYTAKIQARVGRWKASWAQGLARTGVNFPAWISRHFGTVNEESVFDLSKMNDPVRPSITFGSNSPGNNRIRSLVQNAVNLRAKAVLRKIKLIISGYSKDVASGIRATSQAHKHRNTIPATAE